MGAIVGVAAEEVVELDLPLVQIGAVVDLRHRKLVLVSEEDAFRSLAVRAFHA